MTPAARPWWFCLALAAALAALVFLGILDLSTALALAAICIVFVGITHRLYSRLWSAEDD